MTTGPDAAADAAPEGAPEAAPQAAAGNGPPARWLAGARSAFAVTVDFDAEEVWIGEHPDNARRPGDLPGRPRARPPRLRAHPPRPARAGPGGLGVRPRPGGAAHLLAGRRRLPLARLGLQPGDHGHPARARHALLVQS